MVAAWVLAACGDDRSYQQAGENDAVLETGSAFQTKASWKVGGTVSGLAGTGLVLELNGDGTLAVEANGRFYFDQKLSTGAAYAVTVRAQPTSVVQTCTVSDGAGVVGSGHVKSVSVSCSPTGTFVATGVPATARRYHSATPLRNGKVLVVGGLTPASYDWPTASAELYDPGTGTFAPTGSLVTARYAHSATLLPDGKVLIAGGAMFYSAGAVPTTSAELYDPSTGSFAPTGSMNLQRDAHTATLLASGKVLVVGGYAGDFVHSAAAELYDPATATFTYAGSLAADRYMHTATLLGDGKVLVAGGWAETWYRDAGGLTPGVPPTFAELYDPATTTFSSLGDLGTDPIYAATPLPDGKVLVAGSRAVVYDAATRQFADAGALACLPQTATLLTSGAALLVGWDCAEIYDPATLSFAPTDTPHFTGSNYFIVFGVSTATSLPGGKVLITGGTGAQLFEILHPL